MPAPCSLQKLPLKRLDWDAFDDLLKKAHKTLARFDRIADSKDISFFQAREIKAQSPKERKTYQDLLAFLEKNFKRRRLSSQLLRQMHKILQPDQKGQFRKKQNWIGPKGCTKKEAYFLPPLYSKISEGMKNLGAYQRGKEKDPLVQLAIYFAQLLIIHLFMDGNGRLARAAIPLFLYEKKILSSPNFYLSAYFRRRRLKYFEKLYLISKAKDWEGWIVFFLQGILEEGEKVIRMYRRYSSSSSSS